MARLGFEAAAITRGSLRSKAVREFVCAFGMETVDIISGLPVFPSSLYQEFPQQHPLSPAVLDNLSYQ